MTDKKSERHIKTVLQVKEIVHAYDNHNGYLWARMGKLTGYNENFVYIQNGGSTDAFDIYGNPTPIIRMATMKA